MRPKEESKAPERMNWLGRSRIPPDEYNSGEAARSSWQDAKIF
jgi:hypothetical protein